MSPGERDGVADAETHSEMFCAENFHGSGG
jgi:hypothetical protein